MKTNNSIEKPNWDLMVRFHTGEASPEEARDIENWAVVSEQNREELDQIKDLIDKADAYYRFKSFDSDSAWIKIHQKTTGVPPVIRLQDSGRKLLSVYYKYAAVIIIAILIGSAGYYLFKETSSTTRLSEVSTPYKQVLNDYVLPDGSTVSMNGHSTILFPAKFNNDIREVSITGEAFFDVASDPSKPFIINAGDVRIKVLGTSFNVNAYPSAEAVEVTVESGIVQVACYSRDGQVQEAELILHPGEKGILSNSSRKLEKYNNTDPNYMAWKTNHLVFESTPLNEVIRLLEKIYHVDILLENHELEELLLTAQFEDKSAEFILDVISLTFDLELTQYNDEFIITKKSASNKKSTKP